MKDQLTNMIVDKLQRDKTSLQQTFNKKHDINVARYFFVDDLLPTHIATQLYAEFPNPKKMRMLHSSGELRLKYAYAKNVSELLHDLHLAFQNRRVVSAIEEITGISNQEPDTSHLAGGISALLKGYYINPHLDSSHDVDKKRYRTVNLLYYMSPNWSAESGGNYELWDTSISKRIVVPSLFNRLVVMETNPTSWHAVNPVLCNEPRRCLFNYYFSENSPTGSDYFHAASPLTSILYNPLFRPRPEQRLRRTLAKARDALLKKTW